MTKADKVVQDNIVRSTGDIAWTNHDAKPPVATHATPRLVLLESPWAGQHRRNTRYLLAAMRDSLSKGEAPFASHLFFAATMVLDDEKPEERAIGIAAGLAWGERAEATVVYCDLSVTAGMKMGISRATAAGRPVEYRTLADWVWPPAKGDK
jgi:hypothetical protein